MVKSYQQWLFYFVKPTRTIHSPEILASRQLISPTEKNFTQDLWKLVFKNKKEKKSVMIQNLSTANWASSQQPEASYCLERSHFSLANYRVSSSTFIRAATAVSLELSSSSLPEEGETRISVSWMFTLRDWKWSFSRWMGKRSLGKCQKSNCIAVSTRSDINNCPILPMQTAIVNLRRITN